MKPEKNQSFPNDALHRLQEQLKTKDAAEIELARLDLADSLDNGEQIIAKYFQEVNLGKHDDIIVHTILQRIYWYLLKTQKPIDLRTYWLSPLDDLRFMISKAISDTFRLLHPGIGATIDDFRAARPVLFPHTVSQSVSDETRLRIAEEIEKLSANYLAEGIPQTPNYEVDHGSIFRQLEDNSGWVIQFVFLRNINQTDFDLLFNLLQRVNRVLTLCTSSQRAEHTLNHKQLNIIKDFIYKVDVGGDGIRRFLSKSNRIQEIPDLDQLILKAETMISKAKGMLDAIETQTTKTE